MSEWFEDESFWKIMFPFIFPPERIDSAGEEVDFISALAKFGEGDVLDLCCGPGRHSVAFAKRGANVTGVDRSAFLLEQAANHAQGNDIEVEWVHQDMRQFVRPDSFDLVLNMFTSFGYFDDKDEDIAVLQNVFDSLRPGGQFLLETASKEWLAKVFQPTTAEETSDGKLLIQRHEIIDDWSRIRNEWIVVKDGQATTFRFHHTVYSAQELKDRMAQVGFVNLRAFGDLYGSEFGIDSARLVMLAKKPGNQPGNVRFQA